MHMEPRLYVAGGDWCGNNVSAADVSPHVIWSSSMNVSFGSGLLLASMQTITLCLCCCSVLMYSMKEHCIDVLGSMLVFLYFFTRHRYSCAAIVMLPESSMRAPTRYADMTAIVRADPLKMIVLHLPRSSCSVFNTLVVQDPQAATRVPPCLKACGMISGLCDIDTLLCLSACLNDNPSPCRMRGWLRFMLSSFRDRISGCIVFIILYILAC